MTPAAIALIALCLALNVGAQLLLKVGAKSLGALDFSAPSALLGAALQAALHPAIIAGFACYLVSVFAWIALLTRIEVSVAYPLTALGFLATAVIAWFALGEAVTAQRLIGIVVIIVGVLLVARS